METELQQNIRPSRLASTEFTACAQTVDRFYLDRVYFDRVYLHPSRGVTRQTSQQMSAVDAAAAATQYDELATWRRDGHGIPNENGNPMGFPW